MIKGVIFDKDGTLFDFNATWGAWSRTLLTAEAKGDAAMLARLADVLGYDLATDRFLPGSIVIAETVETVAAAIQSVIDEPDRDALIERMKEATLHVPQVEAAPLVPFFDGLKARGLVIGVATNDAEDPARRHLQAAGVLGHCDFVAGYDSGYGGKPAPGQLHGFCAAMGLPARNCVMVGDSLHDLEAGRAAGMRTVGVLTGPALVEELNPFADVVLSSIAGLPDWLDSQG